MQRSKMAYIGKIINTFGIKGELKIYSESDFIEYRYQKGAVIYIDNKQHIVSSFRIHQNMVLITIDDIKDINMVLQYVGKDIYASNDDLPTLDEDEYYLDDLIGLKVYNQNDKYLGTVNDFLDLPQGDVMEIITDQKKKILIPFVDEFIIEITNEKIVINEIEGLI